MASVRFSIDESDILFCIPRVPCTIEDMVRSYTSLNRTAPPPYEVVFSCLSKAVSAGIVVCRRPQYEVDHAWWKEIHGTDETGRDELDEMIRFGESFVDRELEIKCPDVFALSREEYDQVIARFR
jgi:hypothetical protein